MRPHTVLVLALSSASAFRAAPRAALPRRAAPLAAAAARPLEGAALRIRGGDAPRMSLAQAFGVYAPAMGVVTSNALYFAALPAVLAARKTGSLGAFNPLPSAIMVLSVFAWLCYGLAVGNPWIVASNLPGAGAVLTTFVVMLPLMSKDDANLLPVQTTLVGGALATLCLWTYLVFGGAAAAARAQFIGYFASSIFVVLAASPLSTIRTVVASRDSSSILAPLTAAQCANTLLWTLYGLFAANDVFVYGPNGIGLALGLAQLALKLLFPSKPIV